MQRKNKKRENSRRELNEEKKGLTQIAKFWIALFLLITILGSFVFIMNDDFLLVEEIQIKNTLMTSEDDLEEIVWGMLSNDFLWLIPKKNIFFLPRGDIKKEFNKRHIELERINADFGTISRLEINIRERNPEYLWCNSLKEKPVVQDENTDIADVLEFFSFDEECFFVDYSGLIFKKAPYFSDNVFRKFTNQDKNTVGDYILKDEQKFRELLSFLDDMDSLEIKIRKIRFEDFDDVFIELSQINDRLLYSNEELRVNMNLEYSDTLKSLELMVQNENFSRQFFTERKVLKYIDLRFAGKIIYKFK